MPDEQGPQPAEPSLAMAAAVRHAQSAPDRSLPHALLMDVILWTRSARPLLSEDYQADYQAGGADFYLDALLRTVTFYQGLHAVIAGAVVLARSCADPPIPGRESLGSLTDELASHPDDELRKRLAQIEREVRLLEWLARVRNKAIQHRAGNRHYSSDGILLKDGLAFIRRREPIAEEVVAPARAELERVNHDYGLTLDTGGTSEVFAYLDLVSQQFYGTDDSEFDRLRAAVENARLHQVIMSAFLIENADAALAGLLGAIPVERSRALRRVEAAVERRRS